MTLFEEYFDYTFLTNTFPGKELNFDAVKKHFLVHCQNKPQAQEEYCQLLRERIDDMVRIRDRDMPSAERNSSYKEKGIQKSENVSSPLKDCVPHNKKEGDTFLSPIYLEWIDSSSYDGWHDTEKADELEPYLCRSFGLLVREDEETLIITHTETYGLGAGFRKMFDGLMSIPKRAVTQERRYAIAMEESPQETCGHTFSQWRVFHGIPMFFERTEGEPVEVLRGKIEVLRKENPTFIAIIGSRYKERGVFVVGVSEDLAVSAMDAIWDATTGYADYQRHGAKNFAMAFVNEKYLAETMQYARTFCIMELARIQKDNCTPQVQDASTD